MQGADVKWFLAMAAFCCSALGGALLYYVFVIRSPLFIVAKLSRSLGLLFVATVATNALGLKLPRGINTQVPGRVFLEYGDSLVDAWVMFSNGGAFLLFFLLYVVVYLNKDWLDDGTAN